jgi:methionyl-tRNA formyltransferase
VKVWRARAAEAAGELGTIDDGATLATAASGLSLDEVQPEGKRRMAGSEWSKGVQLPARVDS